MSAPRRIVVAANTSWNILNYRLSLICMLRDQGHDVVLFAPEDEASDALRQLGFRLEHVQMTQRGRRFLSEIKVLRRFYEVYRSHRPDLILSFTTKSNVYSGVVARILSLPFIPNVCGRGTTFSKPGLLRRSLVAAHRAAFQTASYVFFQNKDDASFFYECGIAKPGHAEVLPGSGVKLSVFDYQPPPGQADAPVVLMISRLLVDKGIREYARAAEVVKARVPRARFVLAGRHEDASDYLPHQELEDWIGRGVIEYRGELADVRPALQAADIVALPSYYMEGTPRALLEAAAMGRPIVTTDTPGCRDTLIPGKTGFLVRPRDAGDLAEKLLHFAELSVQSRAVMGIQSRRHAQSIFDERFVLQAYDAAVTRTFQQPKA
jgi:glycosyltransferase involved in cell wall biosynthesis